MSWKAEYVILIMISTLIDYTASRYIEKSNNSLIRKLLLILSLSTNLGLLFTFKYFNFVSDSVREFLTLFSIPLNPTYLSFLLPIGISFYTFQTIGYTIDVYNKKIKAEKHLGIFALYVSFFPQLVAGPIERAKNLLPQFYKKHPFCFKEVTYGLQLMLWGFFLKCVIADNLGVVVDQVYGNVGYYTGLPLIIATIFFAFQIFCDFAGYSTIAIGAAQIMGFTLMTNFRRPYFSKSISEFWRRWHISLTSWFKDYIYIPLGGNRVPIKRVYFNLFIIFLISGIWHGAAWHFIVWGTIHGSYMILGVITENPRRKFVEKIGLSKLPKIHTLIQILITFILVNIGWVFFRANNLSDAVYVLKNMFVGLSFNLSGLNIGLSGIQGWFTLIILFILIGIMEIVHLLQEIYGIRKLLPLIPLWIRWIIYCVIILIILVLKTPEVNQFVYFQF